MKKESEKPDDQDSEQMSPGAIFLKKLREMPYDTSMVGKSSVKFFSHPSKGMKDFFDRKKVEKDKDIDNENP